MKTRHYLAYMGLVILNAGLGAFLIQLSAGNVPIPQAWEWTIPILNAMLVMVTAFLPRVGDAKQ